MGGTGKKEVFVGTDKCIYTSGVVSTRNFGEPLVELWHRVQKGKRPITIQQGLIAWEREALLVIAHVFGKELRLDRPEEFDLPDGSTYADLATRIEKRLRGQI